MGEVIMFGNIEIEKNNFHCYKDPMFLNDVDIYNILRSDTISSDEITKM